MGNTTQLEFFSQEELIKKIGLDSTLWHGSFNGLESTLNQLSPYVGKLKSGMVQVLISLYSTKGDTVLDPFSGSGVVPFMSALMGRQAYANDLSPYAYVLTRAKLETPYLKSQAVDAAIRLLDKVETIAPSISLDEVPDWIQSFFHPKTLQELIVAFQLLQEHQSYFLLACLLGILHHQRPGFLSYPASHLVPYLRKSKYPQEDYPEMYQYRDVRSRLLSKIKRAYRRHELPVDWKNRHYKIWQTNSMNLPVNDQQVDAIISSPPYFGALDYARDNRLRLWFLGCKNWKELDQNLTANSKVYIPQMSACIKEMYRILKPKKYCILVLGDVERDNKTHRTAEILAEVANNVTNNGFTIDTIYDDIIPDERRSRRKTKTTKFERILVMRRK
ncbi:MAG: DNA methyltransferase [Thermodesulfobacteriota bacterium]